jgi:hypothetical protein
MKTNRNNLKNIIYFMVLSNIIFIMSCNSDSIILSNVNQESEIRAAIAAPTKSIVSKGSYIDKIRVGCESKTSYHRFYRGTTSEVKKMIIIQDWAKTNVIDDKNVAQGVKYYYSMKAAADLYGKNESAFSPVEVGWLKEAYPDLIISEIKNPIKESKSEATYWLNIGIKNKGTSRSTASNFKVWLSTNATLDNKDKLMSSPTIAPIESGKTAATGSSVTFPKLTVGTYYLIYRVDPDNNNKELDETNNEYEYSFKIVK